VSYQGRFHYRTGAVKMMLTGPALAQFLMEKSGRQWDSVPCLGGHRASDFTFIALKNRYRAASGKKLTKDDLLSFGLVTEAGIMTNTGALMADESPIGHCRVFCTRWNGLDMTAGVMDAADDQEYGGGLLQLLKYAEDFVRLHSRRAWHKRPTDRVNFREYPERSIQEMLINGLVHRDYIETGSEVHVDIFDDRIEITSPGGMPGERKVQEYANICRIPSRRRNKCLADVFERLDLMERKGSGFKKLYEDYEKLSVNLGKRMPSLESENDYFRVTLPNLLYGFTDEQLVAAVDNSEYGVAKDAPQTATTHPGAYHDTYHDAYHDTYHEKQEVKPNEIKLLKVLASRGELGAVDLRKAMDIKYSSDLRERYLRPLCRAGCIEFTLPNAKRSKLQKYRLTAKGRALIASIDVKQH
jgi:predicted HTH transcriptional regulator